MIFLEAVAPWATDEATWRQLATLGQISQRIDGMPPDLVDERVWVIRDFDSARVAYGDFQEIVDDHELLPLLASQAFDAGVLSRVSFSRFPNAPSCRFSAGWATREPSVAGVSSFWASSLKCELVDPDYGSVSAKVADALRCCAAMGAMWAAASFGEYEPVAYDLAAGRPNTDFDKLSGEKVLDTCWQMLLPPRVVATLGGLEVVLGDAPVEHVEAIEWKGGGHGALAVVAEDPTLVDEAGWRAWRDFLLPVLPVHPRKPQVLHANRPMHILEEDWIRMPIEEARKLLPGL